MANGCGRVANGFCTARSRWATTQHAGLRNRWRVVSNTVVNNDPADKNVIAALQQMGMVNQHQAHQQPPHPRPRSLYRLRSMLATMLNTTARPTVAGWICKVMAINDDGTYKIKIYRRFGWQTATTSVSAWNTTPCSALMDNGDVEGHEWSGTARAERAATQHAAEVHRPTSTNVMTTRNRPHRGGHQVFDTDMLGQVVEPENTSEFAANSATSRRRG